MKTKFWLWAIAIALIVAVVYTWGALQMIETGGR